MGVFDAMYTSMSKGVGSVSTDVNEQMRTAIFTGSGDLEGFKHAIRDGADIHHIFREYVIGGVFKEEVTALDLAFRCDHPKIINELIRMGAIEPKERNGALHSLLGLATHREGFVNQIRELVASGAALDPTNEHHAETFGYIIKTWKLKGIESEELNDIVIKLIRRGMNSGLSYAIRSGNLAVVKESIAAGADVNKRSFCCETYNFTALMLATFHGHLEAVKALIRGGAELGSSACVACTAPSMIDAVSSPIQYFDFVDAFAIAVEKNHSEIASELLSAGAKPDRALIQVAKKGDVTQLNRLLRLLGPNVDAQMFDTAVKVATINNHHELAGMLLECQRRSTCRETSGGDILSRPDPKFLRGPQETARAKPGGTNKIG